jgi:YspA, cpYpsA-related SLOG family
VRLLICGTRTWTDRIQLGWEVETVIDQHPDEPIVLIEGDARGADRLAGELARARGWDLEVYPADWQHDGRAAGPRRNARMLHQGRPDLVMAFVDKPLEHSRGTADLVRRARAQGVEVRVIERR